MRVWFPAIKGTSGADVFTRRLAEALRRRGVATEITWFPPYFQFAPFLLSGIRPPSGIQIIHANTWNGFAFKRPGVPLVVTKHLNLLDGPYASYKSRPAHMFHNNLVRRFEIRSYRSASAITSVSRHTASSPDLFEGGFSTEVIFNWADTASFTPSDAEVSLVNRPFRLLFVGNPTRRKGADLLAPIMNGLGREFELHFTSGLRKLRPSLLCENMKPLGHISQEGRLADVYRQCDALLFPTRLEGFSLVSLEAMACGKPVIGSDIPSLRETVDDGKTGILCPMDDVDAFIRACRRLADDRGTLLAYGRAARERVKNLFSEESIIPKYVALYEKVLGGPHP